ncbi:hypothetical protein A0J61_08712 [Choanephora cucurbitarum]|uniref:Uncharacterized protein n=1 Tax=Choanephora cucurbitarum TaxID=101091 RepID=A0A1C7N2F2_9FUNG|nr:hypothetical protein A0J61_08712 [Choanephora cucurbitarum]
MHGQIDPTPGTFLLSMADEAHIALPATPEDYVSLDENSVVEEDATKDADYDTSRSKLNTLKGFFKSLLFREADLPNEQALKDMRSGLVDKEVRTGLLILRRPKPYILCKNNFAHTAYQ